MDIRVITPDGARQIGERRRAPVPSRTAAERWAEGRERVLFQRHRARVADNFADRSTRIPGDRA